MEAGHRWPMFAMRLIRLYGGKSAWFFKLLENYRKYRNKDDTSVLCSYMYSGCFGTLQVILEFWLKREKKDSRTLARRQTLVNHRNKSLIIRSGHVADHLCIHTGERAFYCTSVIWKVDPDIAGVLILFIIFVVTLAGERPFYCTLWSKFSWKGQLLAHTFRFANQRIGQPFQGWGWECLSTRADYTMAVASGGR